MAARVSERNPAKGQDEVTRALGHAALAVYAGGELVVAQHSVAVIGAHGRPVAAHWMPWVVVTGSALSSTGVIFTELAGVPLSEGPDVRVLWRIALTFHCCGWRGPGGIPGNGLALIPVTSRGSGAAPFVV